MKPKKELKVVIDPSGVMPISDPKAKRIYVSVNAIAFICNQLESRYGEMVRLLKEIDKEQGGPLKDRAMSVQLAVPQRNQLVATAWDFVDWAERLRKVLGVQAGLKKSDEWYKALSSALFKVESLRNFIQHYDGSMKELIAGTYPIMGAVFCWFKAEVGCYARVILSTPARFAGDSSVVVAGVDVVDEVQDEVDFIHLSVASLYLNLSDLYRSIKSARADLQQVLAQKYEFPWPTE